MDPSEMIRRGHEAKRILESPVFQEAVQEVDRACVARWRTAVSVLDREEAHSEQKALYRVVDALRVAVDNGLFEQSRIDKSR